MSAKHAVLGLVIEQPGYGYQLGRRLEERCGAWGWESSGVYSALDSLARDENVRSIRGKGSGATGRAAPRAVYEATAKGLDFFWAWMCASSSPAPVRQELDLKILLSGPAILPRLIDQTWAQAQMCIDELKALTAAVQPSAAGRALTWREATVLLQRDAEIKSLQVRIEWLQDVRQVMARFIEPSPSSRAK